MADDAVSRHPLRCQSCRRRFFSPRALGQLPFCVAADAVVHRKLLERSGGRAIEGLHRTMAGLAGYLRGRHVGPMGKEYVRRQAPHPPPRHLLPPFPVALKLLDLLALGISSHVATQAKCRGWATGDDIFLRALVTSSAGKVECYVSLVRKRDGLLGTRLYPTRPIAPHQRHSRNDED